MALNLERLKFRALNFGLVSSKSLNLCHTDKVLVMLTCLVILSEAKYPQIQSAN